MHGVRVQKASPLARPGLNAQLLGLDLGTQLLRIDDVGVESDISSLLSRVRKGLEIWEAYYRGLKNYLYYFKEFLITVTFIIQWDSKPYSNC